MTEKYKFKSDGKFAKGTKAGPGRRPGAERGEFNSRAQGEYRAWISRFSEGKGIETLPSDAIAILRAAKICYAKLLYLDSFEKPSDGQLKLVSQMSTAVGKLLSQVEKIVAKDREEHDYERIR